MNYAFVNLETFNANTDTRKQRRCVRTALDATRDDTTAKEVRLQIYGRSASEGQFVRTTRVKASPAAVANAIRATLDTCHGCATHIYVEAV